MFEWTYKYCRAENLKCHLSDWNKLNNYTNTEFWTQTLSGVMISSMSERSNDLRMYSGSTSANKSGSNSVLRGTIPWNNRLRAVKSKKSIKT